MNEWWLYLLVCGGALFAGFIDAVVGGGGLIQVPLLMILFPELSHVQVIASNRFASLAGTSVAAFQYIRMIGVDTGVVLATGITAAIASFSGTFVMELIKPEVFKPLLLCIIIVLAVYTFMKKDLGHVHAVKYSGNTFLFVCAGIGAVIGFYNGFIGPGTGSLLVFAFVSVAGLSFLHASASAKIINAIADVASLIGFLLNGAVVFKIAVPMMLFNMLGAYIGSKAAILKGSVFIRYVFLLVISILIIRLGRDVLLAWNQ
nr:TSUP family transporter [uncultured Lacibacter sp.]